MINPDAAFGAHSSYASRKKVLLDSVASEASAVFDGRTTSRGLVSFLDAVLCEVIDAAGAASGTVFLHDAARKSLRRHALIVRGTTIDLARDPRSETFRSVIPAHGSSRWELVAQGRRAFQRDYRDPDADDHAYTKSWHEAHGHRFVVTVPMLHRSTAIGFFGLAYDRAVARPLSSKRLEACQVLAQQATLAVRLTRLADETRDAALARDRAVAAEERACELERANEALRRAMGDLADIDAIDDFLAEMLRAAMDAAGAANGTIALVKGDVLERPVIIHGSERLSRATKERLGVWRSPAGRVVAHVRKACAQSREWAPRVEDLTHLPAMAAYHRALNNLALRFVPLTVRGELVGWIGLGFSSSEPELTRGTSLLSVLAGQITVAVEMARLGEQARLATLAEERNRVAGEIHDSLAQNFAGVALQLETAEDALQGGEVAAAQTSLGRARELARFGLAEARRSVMTLRPSATLATGLAPALEALCARSEVEGKLSCAFVATGASVLLDGESELALFRIAQEAVSNAVRHAQAARIALELTYDSEGVALGVTDDGRGLTQAVASMGQGLPAMRDRAHRVGGRCDVHSPPEGGTRVQVWVPYRR